MKTKPYKVFFCKRYGQLAGRVCPRINSDDWDELEDCCQNCSGRGVIETEVEVFDVVCKKDLKLFKPGMIIDYYTHIRHGKFRKQRHLYSVEILDVDGEYALVNQLDKDNEHEINLEFEMKYNDEMDLRTKDGTIIKKWGFGI